MTRALGLAVLLALVLAAPAFGGGSSLGVVRGAGGGTTTDAAGSRYFAFRAHDSTVVAAVRKRDGAVVASRLLAGQWGIPVVAMPRLTGGLSHDGRVLVLGDGSPQRSALRSTSRLLLLEADTLRTLRRVVLRGDFSYDALSPDGGTLYLVEHVSQEDTSRYRVRAYDVAAGRLVSRVVADPKQEGWTMTGFAVARATGPAGRWVYTMYRQPANYPFVHALDTVARRAVCIPLKEPWWKVQAGGRLQGALRVAGDRLLIADRPGVAARFALDRRTVRLVSPEREGGRPIVLGAGLGAGALLLLAATAVLVRRRTHA